MARTGSKGCSGGRSKRDREEVHALRVVAEAEKLLFAGPLAGTSAFVDADVVPRAGDLVVEAVHVDTVADALAVFAAKARSVADELEDTAKPVDVVGDGITAACLRRLIGADAYQATARTIVDFTGDPVAIADALTRLPDLGTLFLAGSGNGRALDLELYPDLHLRGLTIVGLSPEQPPAPRPVDFPQPSEPVTVEVDVFVARGAAWYHVRA